MGNSASSLEIPGGGTDGYHVLQIQPNSPAEKAGLEPFFDYIVSMNGVRLEQDDGKLKSLCRERLNQPTVIGVFSSKDQSYRELTIIPSESWGGAGLLGASIRFCSFEGASESVFHVLDVQPGSPAAQAGLMSSSDYIITADAVLEDMDDFNAFVERNDKKQINLYVYNVDTDSSRLVRITPNKDWGGEGMLGCGIGYGYLHRIPARARSEPPQAVTVQTSSATTSDGFSDVPLDSPTHPSAVNPSTVQRQLQAMSVSSPSGSLQPMAKEEPISPPPSLASSVVPATAGSVLSDSSTALTTTAANNAPLAQTEQLAPPPSLASSQVPQTAVASSTSSSYSNVAMGSSIASSTSSSSMVPPTTPHPSLQSSVSPGSNVVSGLTIQNTLNPPLIPSSPQTGSGAPAQPAIPSVAAPNVSSIQLSGLQSPWNASTSPSVAQQAPATTSMSSPTLSGSGAAPFPAAQIGLHAMPPASGPATSGTTQGESQ